MRIVLIGPGIMPIPPKGWGAVESLIWDISQYLQKFQHEVLIVNTNQRDQIVDQTNAFHPDVVHLQYDDFIDVLDRIHCNKKFATSHYAYIENYPNPPCDSNYLRIFNGFVHRSKEQNLVICALSPGIASTYKRAGVTRLYVTPNGADAEKFVYTTEPKHADKTIYLAKIESRKRQCVYQKLPSICFAGNCITSDFDQKNPNYLGEWNKEKLYTELTHYGNLALLSNGEAHPLVVCEALVCGLGLVLSECAAANLEPKPWIHIIPNKRLDDPEYVEVVLNLNRLIALKHREEIRQYGLKEFSWDVRVRHLLDVYNKG